MKSIFVIGTALVAQLFTMCQGGSAPVGCCKHGDRLDVIMQNAPDWYVQCNNMGGEPIEYASGLKVCEGVDF